MNKLITFIEKYKIHIRQRLCKLNWRFITITILIANLATFIDGDFFDWKMNGAILFMIIIYFFN